MCKVLGLLPFLERNAMFGKQFEDFCQQGIGHWSVLEIALRHTIITRAQGID